MRKNNDHEGLLLSILYLVKETRSLELPLSAAGLLESAYALVKDCEPNPDIARDLMAAIKAFEHFSLLDKNIQSDTTDRLSEMMDTHKVANFIFHSHKGKKQ